MRGHGQHILDHDSELGVEVVGHIGLVVLAIDDFALEIDDLDGSVWVLHGS